MTLKILIAAQKEKKNEDIRNVLISKGYEVECAWTGKDAQLLIYQQKYFAVILDLEIKNHSGLNVLKYLKFNSPSSKIILLISSKEGQEIWEEIRSSFRELGISGLLNDPFSAEDVLAVLDDESKLNQWKRVQHNKSAQTEQEVTASDSQFTRIKVEDFLSGNTTIFDLYVRINSNKYIKILHRGDYFEKSRVNYYREVKKIEYLYFLTQDRLIYIDFINSLLDRLVTSPKASSEAKMQFIKNAVDQYIDEVYVRGLKPQLYDQGLKLCKNVFKYIAHEKESLNLLLQMEKFDPNAYEHSFLISLYSTILARNIPWISENNQQILVMGAMFHDLGMVKLPKKFSKMKKKDMSDLEYEEYKKHPLFAIEMLSKVPLISEPIKQVIYHHHELSDGSGFPQGLTDVRIYPPAKIVSFVNYFVTYMVENNLGPREALDMFNLNKKLKMKFNKEVFLALQASFEKS